MRMCVDAPATADGQGRSVINVQHLHQSALMELFEPWTQLHAHASARHHHTAFVKMVESTMSLSASVIVLKISKVNDVKRAQQDPATDVECGRKISVVVCVVHHGWNQMIAPPVEDLMIWSVVVMVRLIQKNVVAHVMVVGPVFSVRLVKTKVTRAEDTSGIQLLALAARYANQHDANTVALRIRNRADAIVIQTMLKCLVSRRRRRHRRQPPL